MPTFRATICGLTELPGHAAVGITHVLSILDPEWPVPDAFGAFGEHARLELRFHDIIEPQPGLTPPEPAHVAQILALGQALQAEPAASLLVHCHAGISRSTAATLAILAQAQPGATAELLAQMLAEIRQQAWPNLRMVEFADAQLGSGGTLIAAAAMLYRRQIARRPELATAMRDGGRGREVTMAE